MDIKDMKKIFEEAIKIKEKFKEIQNEVAKKVVVGDAGAGMVKVTVNGKGVVVRIEIDEELINMKDKEMLQDLLLGATNTALEKANQMMEEAMRTLPSRLPFGGVLPFFDLFKEES